MHLGTLVDTSRAVAEASGRLEKIEHLAGCLRRLEPENVAIGVAYLSGVLPQGRIGVGPAAIRQAWPDHAVAEPALTLAEVDAALARIADIRGKGSAAERGRQLHALLARATRAEQEFLVHLLVGELRQGALEGIGVEAVARAAEVPVAAVRRALMLEGDLARVARVALTQGAAGLDRFALRIFRPLKPMLASPAEDVAEALAQLGEAALEYKLDGARVQVHRSGDEVRVFTRQLNDVTGAVPEIVEAARALPGGDLVLDGEALTFRPDGRPQPFQVTMRRFGRRLDVEARRAELPLRAFFFDCLVADGEPVIDRPTSERVRALDLLVPEALRIPRIVTADVGRGADFLREALAHGHEGVMAKAPGAAYAAGARGSEWLKVKRAHTLDLVVLAAEWGHGRRKGWLSNLHLGARDPASGGWAMLGKTFKGMTDATLAWQTEQLLAREVARDEWTVHVRPELVAEIAFSGVQTSTRYPAGVALRLARLKRYRPDKRAEDADTLESVRALLEG